MLRDNKELLGQITFTTSNPSSRCIDPNEFLEEEEEEKEEDEEGYVEGEVDKFSRARAAVSLCGCGCGCGSVGACVGAWVRGALGVVCVGVWVHVCMWVCARVCADTCTLLVYTLQTHTAS